MENEIATSEAMFDFSSFRHVHANDLISVSNRSTGGVLGISVVNTQRNGSRLTLTPKLLTELGKPNSIQVACNGNSLILGAHLSGGEQNFNFTKGKGKNIVYSKVLVDFLTSEFNLDFSKRTSYSFRDIKIHNQVYNDAEITFAVIRMIPTTEETEN